MATIRKRGTKYHAQVRRKGARSITKSFRSMKDAKEWSRMIETRIDREELGPDRRSLRNTALAEIVKRYRDEVVPLKKSSDVETIILNAFLKHPICKRSLADLSTQDFASYRDERLKAIKPSSLSRQLAPLRNMFRVAKDEWGLPLAENPLEKLNLKATDNRRQRRLLAGEYDRLLIAAKTRRNPYVPVIIEFAIETAMRRGEILALRWEQVNLEKRCVTILAPKNGYVRTVPLTPKAYDLLHDLGEGLGRVFPVTKSTLKMAWGRLVRLAEIEDLHFHDLRHEAVSRFFEIGLTPPEVASISGHRDIRMLMRYAHANLDTLERKLHRSLEGYGEPIRVLKHDS